MTRHAARALIALLLVTSAGAGLHAAAASCDTAPYVAGLQRALQDVDATPPAAAAARTELSSLQHADHPYAPILDPVLADLATQPPNVRDAHARLQQLTQALALPRGATCSVDSSSAQQVLRGVYRDPAFANLDTTQQPSLLDTIAGFIAGLLSAAAGHLGAAGSVLVGVLVLAAAAGYALLRVRRAGRSRAARATFDEPSSRGTDANVEWRLADAAAQRGDHREAVRRAFRSALLELAQRGHVPVDAAWTTRELLAATSADAHLLALLAPAASDFDVAWYSGRPVDRAQWERARAHCAAVRDAARGARAAAG